MRRENSENFFEVRGLHRHFGEQHVLRGLDLDVRTGESLALLGTSGGGKSVLLKHLACLMSPQQGSVMVEDVNVCDLSERQLGKVRRKIGMMFQGGALFDSLTVGRNVAFPLVEEGGMTADEIEERVRCVLGEVGLGEHFDKMPGDLSGGMRKRVALARAVVSEPECLLYDEPGAGLDPVVADSIDFLIREIQLKKRTTTVIITHELKSVFRVADRVAFLKQGRMYWTGTPDEMKESEDPLLRDFLAGRSGENWNELFEGAQRPLPKYF